MPRWFRLLMALVCALELPICLYLTGALLSANDPPQPPPPPHTPHEWIRQNSFLPNDIRTHRPRAALISLVRSSELAGILQSMSQLERHFNRHHKYPWHFFSETPFTPSFINATSSATDAPTSYHLIPHAHWSIPDFIDRDRFMQSLDYVGAIGVGKGHMVSYRHMCRWNSRFFYHHPALRDYDYYWRVEPDVHFFCTIPYDPFALFAHFGFVYGFNMAILEDARSFPSLWPATRAFVADNPHLLHPDADPTWLFDLDSESDSSTSSSSGGIDSIYNNCQFFSNFEIGDLRFFRGNHGSSDDHDLGQDSPDIRMRSPHDLYVDHLDRLGGFFYERFGDAPIHTLSVSLFAPRDRIWWFGDIGYQHDKPPAETGGYVLADVVGRESLKTRNSWLEKKVGWDRDVELAWGGDGYGGYVRQG
ncbi:hypothetical protein DV735_g2770, partial [Chaetothyriales sp. CBS 134920]